MKQKKSKKKKKPVVLHINPPPSNRRCECCYEHMDNVPAFGGAGDPLVGDFKGAKLIKTFRAMTYHVEEMDKILNEVYEICRGTEQWEDFESELIKRVGEEKARNLLFYDQLVNSVEASWECRNCVIIYGKEFFDKRHKHYTEYYKKKKDDKSAGQIRRKE
jgi:hypothetical protein